MDNNSNMLQFCRLCLVKDEVNIPIFEEQGDIRQIFLKISSCLPVKVSRDDQLPKKICDGCSYKLDMLYEFWNTSANAEKQLLTWLGEAGMTSQMADGTISAVAQQIKPADDFVKQERIDPPDIHSEDDDKDYMFQEKQEEKTKNNVDEPPPKRARRTAAVKAAIAMDQDSDDDDSGEPMTKIEDDSEDSDNDDHEPAFVDVPSTSADDQPGPSGVGKDGVEAPKIIHPPPLVLFMPVKQLPLYQNGPAGKFVLLQPKGINFPQQTNQKIIRKNPLPVNNTLLTRRVYFPSLNTTSYQIPSGQIKQPDQNDSKPGKVAGYQNPFNYSCIVNNMNRSFAQSRIKKIEKEINEKKITSSCVLCDEVYQSKRDLIDHYTMHKNVSDQLTDENIKCPVCEESFKNQTIYQKHVTKKHMPKEYFCNICKKNYSNYYYLSVHMARHNDDQILICCVCKSYSTKDTSSLAAHITMDHVPKIFCCEECGKNFISEAWFKGHKIFHYKNPKYFCECCNVNSENQREFKTHMKKFHLTDIHLEIPNYKCYDCNFSFPTERNLMFHKHYLHTKRDKPDFLCNVCGRKFLSQGNLSFHMKIHGDGEYVCNFCGKKFKQSRALQIHMRIHTGEKPHKCEICGKCFTQKPTLNVHMRIHTGERPYPCGRCQKGFITKTIRDTHQKTCKKC